jgi:long-chain acyl-CoA synthetase
MTESRSETQSPAARVAIGRRDRPQSSLWSRAEQAASGLAALGIRRGDAVALLLRNDIPFLEASTAAGILGAYPVAMNWHATAAEAAYILGDSGAKAIIGHDDLLAAVAHVIPSSVTIVAVATPPEIREAYRLGPDFAAGPPIEAWDEWIERYGPWQGDPAPAPGAIIYTSGTTGAAKGVKRAPSTAQQAKDNARLVAAAYGLESRSKRIVSLACAPLYHAAPNMHVMTSLGLGADIILQPRFDPEETLELIARHRITHAYFAPIMFSRLLQLPEAVRGRHDVSSLEYVVHAAAPCPATVKRAMIAWWGPVIHEFYGSTETRAVTSCSSAEWLDRPGTVGRALPGAVVCVIGDDATPAAPGVRGEIICSHPNLTDFTYHGDEAKRAAVGRDKLIATGDIGYLDEGGYLFICDRATDMVISGGVNIYPAEIEAEIQSFPGVKDCAVFGVPDHEFGEALMAAVESVDGRLLDLDALRAALRQRLSSYKVPCRFEQREALPREDSGKLMKRKLRAPYWADAQRQI